jgi:pyridoxine 4-dehydrogenase
MNPDFFAAQPATIIIGDNTPNPLTVRRMGYGTMRLTGPGIWGQPADPSMARQILKKALDAGINFIDTADYYGPSVTNLLIAETLYPYPQDLVICTKVGAKRNKDKSWVNYSSPEELRVSIDNNLSQLKLDRLPVVHFRVMPEHSRVPFKESLQAMFDLQKEGKILHVGLSNVTADQLNSGMHMGNIATVQNLFSYHQRTALKAPYGETRGGQEVLAICEAGHIPLIPFFSLITSLHAGEDKMTTLMEKYRWTKAQCNLAWLLHVSPWIMPIPGTSSLDHLLENLKSTSLPLTKEEMEYLG